jgi:preprotein translocase subunit SecY
MTPPRTLGPHRSSSKKSPFSALFTRATLARFNTIDKLPAWAAVGIGLFAGWAASLSAMLWLGAALGLAVYVAFGVFVAILFTYGRAALVRPKSEDKN